ncbi:MAG: lasso peptide biosynthesis PqqD family chaperone [Candidatus Cohnella colombiensis]|uniref:Lasso peptide biosynthesis PqqD family chaperone n=1 Tax=Candidatus Cohnella colombiensis TaxID=3121368 RepID=A0AA95F115_9BACL|nr:MAG: lasso peptide biosynthesis PqqD family chaperone [Cohnella sp.]
MITNVGLTLEQVVVQAEGNVVSDMDGDKVMLNVEKGKYYNLGAIGGRIWDAIGSPISIRHLVLILMAEYAVDQAQCEEHVLSFLDNLHAEGLIYATESGLQQ